MMNLRNKEGIVGVGKFEAIFHQFESETKTVALTSAGAWIVLRGPNYAEYVVLVQQADRQGNPWEIPSGGADPNRDKNIFQTIVNEVREETGITLYEDHIMPLAVTIKRSNVEAPEKFPKAMSMVGDVWVDVEALNNEKNLKGGYVGLYVMELSEATKGWQLLSGNSAYTEETLFFLPPNSVDQSEISMIALVPVDGVLNGTSPLIYKSSHPWAHFDGLKAFVAAQASD